MKTAIFSATISALLFLGSLASHAATNPIAGYVTTNTLLGTDKIIGSFGPSNRTANVTLADIANFVINSNTSITNLVGYLSNLTATVTQQSVTITFVSNSVFSLSMNFTTNAANWNRKQDGTASLTNIADGVWYGDFAILNGGLFLSKTNVPVSLFSGATNYANTGGPGYSLLIAGAGDAYWIPAQSNAVGLFPSVNGGKLGGEATNGTRWRWDADLFTAKIGTNAVPGYIWTATATNGAGRWSNTLSGFTLAGATTNAGRVTEIARTFTTNIDWSLGNFFVGTNTGTNTITFSNPATNTGEGQTINVKLYGTAASAYTFTNSVLRWSGGTHPAGSTNLDVFTFISSHTNIAGNSITNF